MQHQLALALGEYTNKTKPEGLEEFILPGVETVVHKFAMRRKI